MFVIRCTQAGKAQFYASSARIGRAAPEHQYVERPEAARWYPTRKDATTHKRELRILGTTLPLAQALRELLNASMPPAPRASRRAARSTSNRARPKTTARRAK